MKEKEKEALISYSIRIPQSMLDEVDYWRRRMTHAIDSAAPVSRNHVFRYVLERGFKSMREEEFLKDMGSE